MPYVEAFYSLILPRIYHTIKADQLDSERFARTLSEKPQHNYLVRSVEWRIKIQLYYRTAAHPYVTAISYYAYSPAQHDKRLAAMLGRLSSFSNMRCLRVGFRLEEDPFSVAPRPTDLMHAAIIPFLPTAQQLAQIELPSPVSFEVDFGLASFRTRNDTYIDFQVKQDEDLIKRLVSSNTTQSLVMLNTDFAALPTLKTRCNGLTSLVIKSVQNAQSQDNCIGELAQACPTLAHLVLDFSDSPVSMTHIWLTLLALSPLPQITSLQLSGLTTQDDNSTVSFNLMFPAVSSVKMAFFDFISPTILRSIFPLSDPCINLCSIGFLMRYAYQDFDEESLRPLPANLQIFYDQQSFPALMLCSFECPVGELPEWREFLDEPGQASQWVDEASQWARVDQKLIDDFEALQVPTASRLDMSCEFLRTDVAGLKGIRRVGTADVELLRV